LFFSLLVKLKSKAKDKKRFPTPGIEPGPPA
jgi:hypothetical protein